MEWSLGNGSLATSCPPLPEHILLWSFFLLLNPLWKGPVAEWMPWHTGLCSLVQQSTCPGELTAPLSILSLIISSSPLPPRKCILALITAFGSVFQRNPVKRALQFWHFFKKEKDYFSSFKLDPVSVKTALLSYYSRWKFCSHWVSFFFFLLLMKTRCSTILMLFPSHFALLKPWLLPWASLVTHWTSFLH